MMPGKGKMSVTGNLRDVMKESIQAANAYVRSRAHALGIPTSHFEKKDIHVHVPEGATPKDGPSAGVAMVTAIISIMTGIPVKKDVAMTGEITLRGRVLPIGGLKEKMLAALRAGIKTIVIPEENVKDLAEIGDEVKSHLQIVPASRMDDVLEGGSAADAEGDSRSRRRPRGRCCRRGQGGVAHHGALTRGTVLPGPSWRAERSLRALGSIFLLSSPICLATETRLHRWQPAPGPALSDRPMQGEPLRRRCRSRAVARC